MSIIGFLLKEQGISIYQIETSIKVFSVQLCTTENKEKQHVVCLVLFS